MVFLKRKKKGLSPLIAAVLLIVFTIGIATIIMSWINTYTKDTTSEASQNTQDLIDCASTNMDIQDVYILAPTSVKVIARNTGMKPIIIKEGHIWDTNGTSCMLNFTASLVDEGISFNLINTTCPITFTAGCPEFQKVTISTTCSGVTSRFEDISKLNCNI